MIVNVFSSDGETEVRLNAIEEGQAVDAVEAVHTLTNGLVGLHEQYFSHLDAEKFSEIISTDLLRKMK